MFLDVVLIRFLVILDVFCRTDRVVVWSFI